MDDNPAVDEINPELDEQPPAAEPSEPKPAAEPEKAQPMNGAWGTQDKPLPVT
ncbi:MAG TPA: hypothetical protein VHX38_07740 [Pseudonocardiaceae bacterium]|jgi:hypothetical protein|nr:hypothetical protein [Pseudonocardiaceae bacterium]